MKNMRFHITKLVVAIVLPATLSFGSVIASASAAQAVTFGDCMNTLMAVGSSGGCVVALQQALNGQGSTLTVDGQFGPLTQQAVQSFQSRMNLTVDGIAGPNTLNALASANNPPVIPVPAAPTAPTSLYDCVDTTMQIGSSGTCVALLQHALYNQNIKIADDGSYGYITEDAVMSYQLAAGLAVDGIAGPIP